MHNKQELLLRITSFFWIITKINAYNAWVAEGRLYPVVPVFDFMDALPAIVHSILFGLSLAGLASLLIFPLKRILLISTLIVILCSCALDVLRWQPWEYQFIFFLLIFIFNPKNPRAVYSTIVFVLASIYIYSGLHKLNGGFLRSVWESMMLQQFFGLSKATIAHYKLHYTGLAIPLIETAAGLGLLFVKRKAVPALVLIAMHIFIIIMLSGVGINYNSIVLPWNFAMLLSLYFFYYKEHYQFSFPDVIKGRNTVVFLMWGILPALSFAGYWDTTLSSSLYSGVSKRMDICIKNPDAAKPLKKYFSATDKNNNCNGEARLPLNNWSIKETHVLPHHEAWYFERFKTRFEKMYPGTGATFVIYAYPFKEKTVLK